MTCESTRCGNLCLRSKFTLPFSNIVLLTIGRAHQARSEPRISTVAKVSNTPPSPVSAPAYSCCRRHSAQHYAAFDNAHTVRGEQIEMKNIVRLPGAIVLLLALPLLLPAEVGAAPLPAENKGATSDQQQMRGLDEQVQEVKSDVLSISQELSRLEEKLLYPSGTQVAIFVALAKGNVMRLDSVRLQIDGQMVAQHIYSAKELEALRKGGVQRIYVGNVSTGNHQLEVLVEGKLEGGDFSRTEHFTFRKEVKPKLVGLTMAGPRSGNTAISLEEY